MGDLRTSVIVDLKGNLPRQARRFGQQFTRFAKSSKQGAAVLRRSLAGVDRQLDRLGNRYTALIATASIAAAGRQVINFDADLKQLAVDADITDMQLAKVKSQILEVANSANIRVDRNDLLGAMKEIIAQTGNLDVAVDNLRNIGLLMRATGAAGSDAGALVANFYEKFQIRDAQAMLNVLDESALLGKAGAFELRNLATEGNSVTAAYAGTGRVGPTAVREMNAMLQIIRRTTPSAAEASTAFERLLSTLTIEKVSDLQQAGIQIWDIEKLKEGVKISRPIPSILKDILTATNGDVEILGKIFDIRSMRAVRAFMLEFNANNGALPSMERFLAVTGDGSQIIKDAGRNAQTAKAAIQSLKNTGAEFASDKLSDPLKDAAAVVGEVGQERAKSALDVLATGAAILGTAVIGRKVLRGRGGKKGKLGGALGAAGAGAPIPVFVVNLPGAGGRTPIGGAADLGAGKADGKAKAKPKAKGNVAKVTAAARSAAGRAGKLKNLAAGFAGSTGQKLASGGRAVLNRVPAGATKVISGAGRAVTPLAVGLNAVSLANVATDKSLNTGEKLDQSTELLGGVAGSIGGAKLGATIGTFILPGLGTAIGAGIGGLGGYFVGEFAGDKLGDLFDRPEQPEQPEQPDRPDRPEKPDRPKQAAPTKPDQKLSSARPNLRNRRTDRVRFNSRPNPIAAAPTATALAQTTAPVTSRQLSEDLLTDKLDSILARKPQQQELAGTVTIKVDGPGRVASMRSNNKAVDFEAEHRLGLSMAVMG